jgi:hypothetical protein
MRFSWTLLEVKNAFGVGSLRWDFAPYSRAASPEGQAPRSFLIRLLDAKITSLLMLVQDYKMKPSHTTVLKSQRNCAESVSITLLPQPPAPSKILFMATCFPKRVLRTPHARRCDRSVNTNLLGSVLGVQFDSGEHESRR